MTPDLDAQFRHRPIDLPPHEAAHAVEATARWNGFCAGRSRGIQAQQEHTDAVLAASVPGLFMMAFGLGALFGGMLDMAGPLASLAIVIIGASRVLLGLHRFTQQGKKP